MNEKEYVIRYTDEVYSTKEEMQMGMKINAIDPYWREVLNYREEYSTKLQINTIANKEFFYTDTFGVKGKLESFYNELNKAVASLKSILDRSQENAAKKTAMALCLRGAADCGGVNISDNSINAIQVGTYREDNPAHDLIIRYNSLLNKFYDGKKMDLSDDIASALYKELMGIDGSAPFRDKDFDANAERVQKSGGSIYPYAPFYKIPSLMSDFPRLFMNTEADEVAKALSAIYYIDLVKPFPVNNDAIGCLIAKIILSNTALGKEAFLLPIEEAISGRGNFVKMFSLVQSSGDMTYYFRYAIDLVAPSISKLADEFRELNVSKMKSEWRDLSPEEKKFAASTGRKGFEQMNILESLEATTQETKPVEPTPDQPVIDEKPVIHDEPMPVQEKVQVVSKEEISGTPEIDELSITIDDHPLSPKDVKDYIKYLLEIDPTLNKNQATFLANHCQMGRYYTIQQFKKFTKCAYETARTSMDKLAESNYYKKLQVKNKFVYTPVKKGDK